MPDYTIFGGMGGAFGAVIGDTAGVGGTRYFSNAGYSTTSVSITPPAEGLWVVKYYTEGGTASVGWVDHEQITTPGGLTMGLAWNYGTEDFEVDFTGGTDNLAFGQRVNPYNPDFMEYKTLIPLAQVNSDVYGPVPFPTPASFTGPAVSMSAAGDLTHVFALSDSPLLSPPSPMAAYPFGYPVIGNMYTINYPNWGMDAGPWRLNGPDSEFGPSGPIEPEIVLLAAHTSYYVGVITLALPFYPRHMPDIDEVCAEVESLRGPKVGII